MTRRAALCLCLCLCSSGGPAVAAGPEVVAVSPGAGAGAGRTFTFTYSDADGASDIDATEAVIVSGTDLTGVDACFVHASGNAFWLRDDTNGAWMGPAAAGSTARLANTQCALSAATSSISASGNNVTVTVTLTFAVSFAGTKTIYMIGADRAGLSSGWLEAGTWKVTPLNPAMDVVSSSCADPSKDAQYSLQIISEQGGRVSKMVTTPSCFPAHAFYSFQEGYFLDRRPLPIMGRTSGRFDVLFVFVDTEVNRQTLLDNSSLSESVKVKVGMGRIREALEELLASYTPPAVMEGLRRAAADAVEFTFSVALSRSPHAELELRDGGLGFARHDAVVLLDDLGRFSGIGVRRWPWQRHLFHARDGGYFLNIDPGALTPGLFGNELLRRNVPTLLSEYLIGERTLVREGNITFDRTPIVNPRTGENIEPLVRAYEGKTSIGVYLAGYADVDGDGVTDCIDPYITPTADNVDGDFIPDRFDPDLRFDHRPYSWMLAARTGAAAAYMLGR